MATGKLLVPSLTNVGKYKSTLVAVNLDSAPTTLEFKFRDTEGNLKAHTLQTIPGNGFFSSGDILGKLEVVGSFGPLEIISTNNTSVLAVSRAYSQQRTGGYFEGLP